VNFLKELINNHLFLAVMFGWLLAQIIKTIVNLCRNKSFDARRLYGSGGMPSSHSTGVTALGILSGYMYGFDSFQFAISALLAIIVVYDARGVRYQAGLHAKTINQLIDEMINQKIIDKDEREKRLSEFIGHTGMQILVGAILGLVYSLILIWVGFIKRG